MQRSAFASLFLLAAFSSWCLEPTVHKTKPQTMKFRIAAVTERVPRSSFSRNSENYLIYVLNKKKPPSVAKLVFHYTGIEDGLSAEFADYGLVHKFRALRDRSCDETWQSFSTKVVLQGDIYRSVVTTKFVSAIAVQGLDGDDILPCYVVRMQDYQGSKQEGSTAEQLPTLASQ